jgi:hypothetical protein
MISTGDILEKSSSDILEMTNLVLANVMGTAEVMGTANVMEEATPAGDVAAIGSESRRFEDKTYTLTLR